MNLCGGEETRIIKNVTAPTLNRGVNRTLEFDPASLILGACIAKSILYHLDYRIAISNRFKFGGFINHAIILLSDLGGRR